MADRVSIAVIGPGAIGGTVAAWLAQSPAHTVTLCARTPFEALHVETPEGPIDARPTILTEATTATPVAWVLICTKAYDSESAAAWLPGLAGEGTRIAVLQNGVEHRERFPSWQILPAVVDIPAERDSPGHIRQRRSGTILVPEGGEDFVALFAGTPIAVSTTPDFRTAAWRKLAINCAGAVNALYLMPHRIAHEEEIARLMRALVAECVAVGRAEGAALGDDIVDWVMEHYQSSPPDTVNSIHADRLAGRPTEVDARNGVIARLGAKHGIETPANAMVVRLL